MRRKELEVSAEEAWQIFDNGEYCTLATVDEAGNPYATTLSCARVETNVYFHCANEGKKLEHIKQHARVCLSCVSETSTPQDSFTTYFSSCVLYGTASIVEDQEESIAALRAISEKFTPTLMDKFDHAIKHAMAKTTICCIRVDEITGKKKTLK